MSEPRIPVSLEELGEIMRGMVADGIIPADSYIDQPAIGPMYAGKPIPGLSDALAEELPRMNEPAIPLAMLKERMKARGFGDARAQEHVEWLIVGDPRVLGTKTTRGDLP